MLDLILVRLKFLISNNINIAEKGDTVVPPQSEQMDSESADMLAALRRQIQPHLMMALTPPRIPGNHGPPVAQLNYSLPLPSYMMHVSVTRSSLISLMLSELIVTSFSFLQHVKSEAQEQQQRLSVKTEETEDGDEENVSDVPLNLVATSLAEDTH